MLAPSQNGERQQPDPPGTSTAITTLYTVYSRNQLKIRIDDVASDSNSRDGPAPPARARP